MTHDYVFYIKQLQDYWSKIMTIEYIVSKLVLRLLKTIRIMFYQDQAIYNPFYKLIQAISVLCLR